MTLAHFNASIFSSIPRGGVSAVTYDIECMVVAGGGSGGALAGGGGGAGGF